jgi:hypothetical protein
MTNPQSFAFDDFIVWPASEPPDSLVSYTTNTPTEHSLSGSPASTDIGDIDDVASASQSPARHGQGELPFVQLADWSDDSTYDGHPPTVIYYSIEWKLTINNRMAIKDTEQDLVLVPYAFWDRFLRPKLEKLLEKKLPLNKLFKADETNVMVSVTDRSERDLVKQFNELDIEWPILERQLQAWSKLFRGGKRLRI